MGKGGKCGKSGGKPEILTRGWACDSEKRRRTDPDPNQWKKYGSFAGTAIQVRNLDRECGQNKSGATTAQCGISYLFKNN